MSAPPSGLPRGSGERRPRPRHRSGRRCSGWRSPPGARGGLARAVCVCRQPRTAGRRGGSGAVLPRSPGDGEAPPERVSAPRGLGDGLESPGRNGEPGGGVGGGSAPPRLLEHVCSPDLWCRRPPVIYSCVSDYS